MNSNRKFQLKAKLLYNKEIKKGFWRLALNVAQLSRNALPGQFLNLKLSDGYEPLLRRPFSIHRVGCPGIEILYEVIGKGTEILSQKKPGEYLDAIGPLGNGFDFTSQVPTSLPAGRQATSHVLVAGGMGVAPLIFLAEKIASHKVTKSQSHKLVVLIGAKAKNRILCEKEFKKLGCEIKIATDDGSRGFRGKVTDLLKHLLSTMDYGLSTIYACGPRPMLKEISRISQRNNIPAQISLEEHMACGIGACLGCVVKTKEGYKRVCKEGPVFDARKIIWQEEER